MSKEHLWPEWMGDILSKRGTPLRRLEVLEHIERDRAPIGVITQRVRDGGTHTTKIRVVCEACNNEWMGSLEEAAKRYLEPMMQGQPFLLDVHAQNILATWIALKVLVFEHQPPIGKPARPVFKQTTRDGFMVDRAVPDGFKMWIGRIGGAQWKGSIQRWSGGIAVSPTPLAPNQLPPSSAAPNVQSITWGIGHLLVYVIATSDSNVDRDIGFDVGDRLRSIWPLNGQQPLYWPGTRALSDDEIAAIAATLPDLTRSGKPVQINSRGCV